MERGREGGVREIRAGSVTRHQTNIYCATILLVLFSPKIHDVTFILNYCLQSFFIVPSKIITYNDIHFAAISFKSFVNFSNLWLQIEGFIVACSNNLLSFSEPSRIFENQVNINSFSNSACIKWQIKGKQNVPLRAILFYNILFYEFFE